MKFNKIGAVLVASSLLSQVSFAKEKSSDSECWIQGTDGLSTQLTNNNNNNNHNHNHNHNSRVLAPEEIKVTSSMMS